MNPVVKINQKFNEGTDIPLIVSGEHNYLYDSNGKKYIDFCGGIWNVPFGYSNPMINEKINEQLAQLPFCNMITNTAEIQNAYACKLNSILGTSGLLYTCSGSESIEAAIKTCRKYQSIKKNKRKGITAFNLSYHGTTYGAMSVSGVDKRGTEDYFPLVDEISWLDVPKNWKDEECWLQAVENHFDKNAQNMAGIIIEPVLGSGGIIEVPKKVMIRIEELCRANDILLVVDEVTTGFGRTGISFAFKRYNVKPDLICLSKGITNGYLPLGGLAFGHNVAKTFVSDDATLEHFSTQGGNLLSIAAATGVLELMKNYDTYRVAAKGNFFVSHLRNLLSQYNNIEVRGYGLMVAISFPKELKHNRLEEISQKLRKRGILVYLFCNPNYNLGISMFPSFTSTEKELADTADKIVNQLERYSDIAY